MQPHAGVAQSFGNYIAGVLFTNRHTFRILLCTFHPQIGVCLDGLLMTILGLCLVNPFTAFRPRQVRRPYMPPTKAPTSAPTSAPTKAPTSVQTRIFKAF